MKKGVTSLNKTSRKCISVIKRLSVTGSHGGQKHPSDTDNWLRESLCFQLPVLIISKATVATEEKVICYQLSSENNLPMFQLNAPVVIRAKMTTGTFS